MSIPRLDALPEVRLESQSAFGKSTRFFAALRRAVEIVHDPTLQQRGARQGDRKIRVKLNGAIVKLLTLFQFVEILKGAPEILRLDKGEVSFAIFRRLAFHLCFFSG